MNDTESFVVRPVASVEELARTRQLISRQFPNRRSSSRDRADFDTNRGLSVVAERDGTIVGGVLATCTDDAVKVEVIAVEPEFRRRGIGRQLMESLEANAIRVGARVIYLGGAKAENRAFYWRLGFAGRRSLMQKALPGRLPAR